MREICVIFQDIEDFKHSNACWSRSAGQLPDELFRAPLCVPSRRVSTASCAVCQQHVAGTRAGTSARASVALRTAGSASAKESVDHRLVPGRTRLARTRELVPRRIHRVKSRDPARLCGRCPASGRGCPSSGWWSGRGSWRGPISRDRLSSSHPSRRSLRVSSRYLEPRP